MKLKSNKSDSIEERIKRSKADFLKALKKSLGVVSPACKKSNIDRSTYYEWIEKDPEFKKKVEEINEEAKDFAETANYINIQARKERSVINYLSTKCRDRGYGPSIEIEALPQINVSVVDKETKDNLDNLGEIIKEKKKRAEGKK
jgi:hypothetical protein